MGARGHRWHLAAAAVAAAGQLAPAGTAAVESGPAGPLRSVVAIAAEERVENPFHLPLLRAVLGPLFAVKGPGGTEILGSAVVVDGDGRLLTTEGIALGAPRLLAMAYDGKTAAASIVASDPATGLALLQSDWRGEPPPISLSPSAPGFSPGDAALIVHARPGGGTASTPVRVSALPRTIRAGDRTYTGLVALESATDPSAAGGVVLSPSGEVVAIAITSRREEAWVVHAVPAPRARRVLDHLVRFGEVREAWLGMEVVGVGEGLAPEGSLLPAGLAIRKVYRGSPAEAAGLMEGDVLLGIGGQRIAGLEDYEAATGRLEAGEPLTVSFLRGHARRDTTLTAATFPEPLAEAYLEAAAGLEVAEIPRTLQRQSPSIASEGVMVIGVRPRSAASGRGIEAGDVIREVQRRPVRDMTTLRAAVARAAGRPSILLTIARGRSTYVAAIEMR